jgi:3-phosphoshikimate 1-carboxyvinyltransferase
MSLALAGLRVAGVAIADPGCVAKTFPDYWRRLAALAGFPDPATDRA